MPFLDTAHTISDLREDEGPHQHGIGAAGDWAIARIWPPGGRPPLAHQQRRAPEPRHPGLPTPQPLLQNAAGTAHPGALPASTDTANVRAQLLRRGEPRGGKLAARGAEPGKGLGPLAGPHRCRGPASVKGASCHLCKYECAKCSNAKPVFACFMAYARRGAESGPANWHRQHRAHCGPCINSPQAPLPLGRHDHSRESHSDACGTGGDSWQCWRTRLHAYIFIYQSCYADSFFTDQWICDGPHRGGGQRMPGHKNPGTQASTARKFLTTNAASQRHACIRR